MACFGRLAVMAALGLAALPASADITFNGFLSVVGGQVTSGKNFDYSSEISCPCYIADYPYVGIYDEDWSFEPDTTFGLQANAVINDQLSVTGQLVGRGADEFDVSLEWAYFSYKLGEEWTLQGGRKRLPLFYYSDFFDVGYAYTWIRPPGDLYGWQIVNYNGFNLLYQSQWGDWSATGNLWLGSEKDDDNELLSEVYYLRRIEENWKDMVGGYLDLSYDWFNTRAVYMRSRVDRFDFPGGVKTPINYSSDDGTVSTPTEDRLQHFFGLSFNVDYADWLVRSEFNWFYRPYDSPSEDNVYKILLLGVGYRIGDFTPMLTYSEFKEDKAVYTFVEEHSTRIATLRWDFTESAALKFQYEDFKDDSFGDWFVGDSKSVFVGVDLVF